MPTMASCRFASNKMTYAEEWLRAILADGAEHPAGALLNQAKAVGIAERTLQQARKNIGADTGKQYALNAAGIKRLQAHVWQLAPEADGTRRAGA